jgi:hypothetical protein
MKRDVTKSPCASSARKPGKVARSSNALIFLKSGYPPGRDTTATEGEF